MIENLLVDVVGAKNISVVVYALTIVLAVTSSINLWVKDVESKRFNDELKEASDKVEALSKTNSELSVEILEKTRLIEESQEEIKEQSSLIGYASKLNNSPRIDFEWSREEKDKSWNVEIRNKGLISFDKVRISFLTEFKVYKDKQIVQRSEKPIYRDYDKSGHVFSPGSTLSAKVPSLEFDTQKLKESEIDHVYIKTHVVITLDEYVSVRDKLHDSYIVTKLLKSREYAALYSLTDVEPLFIHQELKYGVISD